MMEKNVTFPHVTLRRKPKHELYQNYTNVIELRLNAGKLLSYLY